MALNHVAGRWEHNFLRSKTLAPVVSVGHAVGDKVRLVKDIWEHDQDGLIPGHYLAHKDEIVVVRKIGGIHPAMTQRIYVSHENRTDASFTVYVDEIEPGGVIAILLKSPQPAPLLPQSG